MTLSTITFVHKLFLPLLATTLLFLAGCATPYTALMDYKGADAGTVVVGAGISQNAGFSQVGVTVRRRGTPNVASVDYSGGGSFLSAPRDFENQQEHGTITLLKLPPGEYELFRYGGNYRYGRYIYYFSPRKEFSIPFTVKTNEITYLGRYIVHGIPAIANELPYAARLMVDDKRDADITVAKKKRPALENASVTSFAPKVGEFIAPSIQVIR